MKKVLFVSNVTLGLYSFRRELIEQLSQHNNVTIMAANNGHAEDFIRMGCNFYDIPMARHGINPRTEIKLLLLYKRMIKKIDPDIVFTYTIKPNIYAGMVCASLRIPYVANITGLGTAIENSGVMRLPMLALYRCGLRKAQKVFFQNHSNLEYMLEHKVVKSKYELIPGSGVNLERYHLLDYPKEDIVNFVFISRIMKEKGIDQYLEAATYFKERRPDICFHVCGSCDHEYEKIIDRFHAQGLIHYHGRIDDIVGMHQISCCTIHPTYYPEGMSNVLLESCACGRPIITTDRPGCREIVDDGVNGFIVNQKDSKDLILKIEKFLSLSWEQRKEMGLAGRAKVERDFDRQIVINKYMEEIQLV